MPGLYDVDAYVKYGSTGVCRVERVERMAFPGQSPAQEYYVLRPIGNPASTVFVPLENEALLLRMRPVLTKAEIDGMILAIRDKELCWIEERKERAEAFHTLLRGGTQADLLMLVSCIYLQKRRLAAAGKKLSSMDEATLKEAEKLVEDEFAFSLGMNGPQVGRYIRKMLAIEENE